MGVSLERKEEKKSNTKKRGKSKNMSKSEENYQKLQRGISELAKDGHLEGKIENIRKLNKTISARKGNMLGSTKRDKEKDIDIVMEIMTKAVQNNVSEKSLLEGEYKYNRNSKSGITKNRYYSVKKAVLGLEKKTRTGVSNNKEEEEEGELVVEGLGM